MKVVYFESREFWDKFQVIWISITQVMAILVEPVQFDEIVLREFLHDENEFSWKNDTYESCRG